MTVPRRPPVGTAHGEIIDREIEARVRARVEHMAWRPRFENWVKARVWQELHREAVVDNVKRYVPRWDQAVILDVGSGLGGLQVRLQQEGLQVIGVDYSLEHCLISRLRGARYGMRTPLVNARGEEIPLRSHSVDVAFCYEVLEHVVDPTKVLSEVRRVLRPGGCAFVTVHNRWTPYDAHYHLWGISYLPRSIGEWTIHKVFGRAKGDDVSAGRQRLSSMHYFRYRQFLKLCRRAGFAVDDIREDKVRSGSWDHPSVVVRSLVRMLARTRLQMRVYSLWRCTIMPEWHFRLVPFE